MTFNFESMNRLSNIQNPEKETRVRMFKIKSFSSQSAGGASKKSIVF